MMKRRKKSNVAEKTMVEFGFGGLLKGLMDSPAFSERLKEVNDELERRLSGRKDFKIERRFVGRKGDFKIESNISVRTLRGEGIVTKPARIELGEIKKEDLTDIFDENNSIRIITELPSAKEDDLRFEINNDMLVIFVGNKERKRIKLPCPAEFVSKKYRNNILEVQLKKVSK